MIYEKYKDNGYTKTIIIAKQTINHFLEAENISVQDINNNKYFGHPIQFHFRYMCFIYTQEYDWINKRNNSQWDITEYNTINVWVIMAAKLGNPESIEMCRHMDWDYKKKLSQKELEIMGLDN